MADKPKYTVTVIATGKVIEVYKRTSDSKWVDYQDCNTVYSDNELKGLPKQ